jgi:hypothetical protein
MATTTALTLYDIESDLEALLNTDEMVPEEQRAEFERELGTQLRAAVDKRQRVGEFIRFCDLQADACKAEIDRLTLRKRHFERVSEQVREYVLRVIEATGEKKLEGRTLTFSLRECPASVQIVDQAAIPADYKRETITFLIDKTAIKKAILAGQEVPGADLQIGKKTLVLR